MTINDNLATKILEMDNIRLYFGKIPKLRHPWCSYSSLKENNLLWIASSNVLCYSSFTLQFIPK